MTLLFIESPLLGISYLTYGGIFYYYESKILLALYVLIFIFLLYFYRYSEFTDRFDDNTIVSPCEGNITMIRDSHDYYYISIFLSPMNKHWQIYPANGTVIKREYDHTGNFNIVMEVDKSKDNEKCMHYLQLNNGSIIKITQIAGFLPRMITYDRQIDIDVLAGEYLGMIKFGSRVELLINKTAPNGDKFILDDLDIGDDISIGDLIGIYIKK